MDREEWLLVNRLVPGSADEVEVVEYYNLLSDRMSKLGVHCLSVAEWYAPGALDNWRRAYEWWPKDAPPRYGCPDLGTLCRAGCRPPPLICEPFMERLTEAWNNVVSWLEENKRNVSEPNESQTNRSLRLARERQARFRARNSVNTPPEERAQAEALVELYKTYMAACAKRKALHASLDGEVREAWAAYNNAKGAAPEDATPEQD